MSVIDLIVGLLMLWAVFNGWRQGLILQLCSLAGIVLGAWLGIRFGTEAGALLHLDEEFAAAGGFLAVFVVVLIAVAIVGRLLRKVFHFAGFGIPDHLLGVAPVQRPFACSQILIPLISAVFGKFTFKQVKGGSPFSNIIADILRT